MATHMYISLQQDDTIAQYDMNPDTGALQRLAAVSVGRDAGSDGGGSAEAFSVRGTPFAGCVWYVELRHRPGNR